MVITESDTILQEYYITRKYKSTVQEGIYIIKTERCSRYGKRDLESQTGEKSGRKNYGDVLASTALRSPREDPLRTLISYSKIIMVQTPGSGHENPGLYMIK